MPKPSPTWWYNIGPLKSVFDFMMDAYMPDRSEDNAGIPPL